MFSADLIL